MAELFKMKLLDVNKNQILPETSADQVQTAGGSNVETSWHRCKPPSAARCPVMS